MNQKDINFKKDRRFFTFLKKFIFSAEEVFTMIIIAAVIMILVLIIKPSIFNIEFYKETPIWVYTLYLIKYSMFMFVYFLLIISSLYWLSKKIFKKWTLRKKIASFVISIIIAILIFLVIPTELQNEYPVTPLSKIYVNGEVFDPYSIKGSFDLLFLSLKPGEAMHDTMILPKGAINSVLIKNYDSTGTYRLRTYDTEFCGEEITYLFMPGCGGREIYDPIIENIQSKIKTQINYVCGGAQKEACDAEGLYHPENMTEFKERYNLEGGTEVPIIFLGCRYSISSTGITEEDLLREICEKIDDCSE